MNRSLVVAALLCLSLSACRSVPDVQNIPVPADPSLASGHYSGTLTERSYLNDARLSRDARSVYLLSQSASHGLLIELDAASGSERRRRALDVGYARQLGVTSSGAVIVAGGKRSVRVDPGTLSVSSVLPAASFVSADGTRLLDYAGQGMSRWDTATGAAIPTVNLPADEWLAATSRNVEWALLGRSKALLNLSTGEKISLSGQPAACNSQVQAGRSIISFDASGSGFVVAQDDGTLSTFDRQGNFQQLVSLLGSCGRTSIRPDVQFAGAQVRALYRLPDSSSNTLGLVSWIPGQIPTTRTLPIGSSLPGSLADPSDLLLRSTTSSGTEQVSDVDRWQSEIVSASYPAQLQLTATFKSDTAYTLSGSLVAGGQSFELSGEGKAENSSSGPKIIFTQTICSTDTLLGNPCPFLSWYADVFQKGVKVGQFNDYKYYPENGSRQPFSGSASLNTFNQDGLGDSRDFGFVLNPD